MCVCIYTYIYIYIYIYINDEIYADALNSSKVVFQR